MTKERFLEAGKQEFLKKGYKEASLRQIAKNLGFTLGAFYGYFKSKADLFDGIVAQPAKELLDQFITYHKNYQSQSPQIQLDHLEISPSEALLEMVSYMYQYFEEFKLIFCQSAGTKYEHFLEKLVAVEVQSSKDFIELMKQNGYFSAEIDDQLCHILASMLFNGIIEVFAHDMNYEYAIKYVKKLELFYTAGWMKLFDI